ncbi:hypothetical protein BCON_0019g00110 [Botryotinia convoluta]|uniref:AA1-like domain-containing protein n=1 Tax=Botryotinia convoluta TaxID=54673 RepID=A0A4Z1IM44_9HELO|nr:hypothetical protein BCON_0019g00110 [Botryotinia convoluta]
MQFSTLLISAAALIPSALGCMNVSVIYTLKTDTAPSNLFISYLDNGRTTCYYNEKSPPTDHQLSYPLSANSKGIELNDTYTGCVYKYSSEIQLDLLSTGNKKKHNVIKSYEYDLGVDTPKLVEYTGLYLGDKKRTPASGDQPETWSWTADFFC